jgi:hypothetical protein
MNDHTCTPGACTCSELGGSVEPRPERAATPTDDETEA